MTDNVALKREAQRNRTDPIILVILCHLSVCEVLGVSLTVRSLESTSARSSSPSDARTSTDLLSSRLSDELDTSSLDDRRSSSPRSGVSPTSTDRPTWPSRRRSELLPTARTSSTSSPRETSSTTSEDRSELDFSGPCREGGYRWMYLVTTFVKMYHDNWTSLLTLKPTYGALI